MFLRGSWKQNNLLRCMRNKSSIGFAQRQFSATAQVSSHFKPFSGATVWAEFNPPYIAEHNAVNLGQGFPQSIPADLALNALNRITADTDAASFANHQYSRSEGNPVLVSTLAKMYSERWNMEIDAMTQVTVATGASGALSNAMMGLLESGDEVVLLEPAFDVYTVQVQTCGAKVNTVCLTEENGEWKLDMQALRAAITPKTRVLVLNTPHNPTGKVFSKQELTEIADILREFPRVVVLADEVYEHMTYNGHEHISFASLSPETFAKTLTVSSAGKTFSCTGWKIGWTIGPAELVKACSVVNQWHGFAVNTPSQLAVAEALSQLSNPYKGQPDFYTWFQQDYNHKRQLLSTALTEAGVRPIEPEGSFFIMADMSKYMSLVEAKTEEEAKVAADYRMCHFLVEQVGIAAIPPTAFITNEEDKAQYENFVRVAFCKPPEVLTEAAARFQKLKTMV